MYTDAVDQDIIVLDDALALLGMSEKYNVKA